MPTTMDTDLIALYTSALEDNITRDVRAAVLREADRREREARRERKRLRAIALAAPPKPEPIRSSPSTVTIGSSNEELAMRALIADGYDVVVRNFRCHVGELDLVVRRADTLVFVEVRSRHDGNHGHAAEMVDAKKRKKVARVASYFIESQRPEYRRARFDVVAVTGGVVEHIVDAWRL